MQIHFYISDDMLDVPGIVRLPRELHRLVRHKLDVHRGKVTLKHYDSVQGMPCRIYEAYTQVKASDDTVPIVILVTMRYTPERERIDAEVVQALIDQVSAHSTEHIEIGVLAATHYL